MAIVFAVKKFHKFIYGRKFTLQTDHKPLLAIFGCKKGIQIYTANRLQRWAIILLAYEFIIEYINTDAFAYVDFLSRLIEQQHDINEDYIIASIKFESKVLALVNSIISPFPVTYKQLCESYQTDDLLQKVKSFIINNSSDDSFISDPKLVQFYNRRQFLSICNDIVLFGERIVIPVKLQSLILNIKVIKEFFARKI